MFKIENKEKQKNEQKFSQERKQRISFPIRQRKCNHNLEW